MCDSLDEQRKTVETVHKQYVQLTVPVNYFIVDIIIENCKRSD